MALTQAQWYARLRTWVPSWFLMRESKNVAILQAFAKVMADRGDENDQLIAKTFLATAELAWLDTHGHERTVERLVDETDDLYVLRIRSGNMLSRTNRVAIQSVVDGLLARGPCRITEDWNLQDRCYADRGFYLNRDCYLNDPVKDAFSIIVPRQTHDPYSFLSRGYYASRADYVGTGVESNAIFASIIKVVDDMKAFGALYRIFESNNAVV